MLIRRGRKNKTQQAQTGKEIKSQRGGGRRETQSFDHGGRWKCGRGGWETACKRLGGWLI